jgi:uncharacterized protein (UPF0333 family)
MVKSLKKNGQSTLEYLLILTAIVGLIIYAAATWIKPAVQASLNNANSAIGKAADKVVPK